jgi:hypothetical protein
MKPKVLFFSFLAGYFMMLSVLGLYSDRKIKYYVIQNVKYN